MQFKALVISAFAAGAVAQTETADLISILSVLQTALPSSLIAEAITNSAAVSSEIASQFAAGATPSWFTGLPSDVQTYLVPPQATVIHGPGHGHGNGTASNGTVGGSNATTSGTASTSSLATLTTSSSGSSSETGSGSESSGAGFQGSSTESGNMAAPTAIFGAGLAGAVGLVGLLAL